MPSRILITIVFSTILLLVACGGGEEEAADSIATQLTQEASDSQQPQEAEAAAPTAEPPTAEPPTTEPPTAEPPTAEPPTAESPTAEPPPEPEAETAATGEGWGASGTTAQSACDHPFFPLREGATWTFTNQADIQPVDLVWEVAEVQGDLQNATAELVISGADVELNYTWECSDDGGVVSFDFASQAGPLLDSFVEFELLSGEGQFLPPEEEMTAGATWVTSFENAFSTLPDIDEEEILPMSGEMSVTQTSTILNRDPVTFMDQVYDGAEIEQDSEIALTMMLLDNSVTQPINLAGRMVLARGVGMIMQTTETQLGPSTTELVEVFIP